MTPNYAHISLLLQLILLSLCNTKVFAGCASLPWQGEWLDNEKSINISIDSIGNLGYCSQQHGDQFLFTSDTDSRGTCYRCLIVFPIHKNALQYRTTQCLFDPSLRVEMCASKFDGNTPLHTLFRKDAPSIPCPLSPPLSFSYHDSAGSCSSRHSSVSRCSQWDRLSFHFEACPENPKREATVSHVECIAAWTVAGRRFFAARVASKSGEQHRCFILDGSDRLGISADSSCLELTHIGAATTTIQYRQDSTVYPECDFAHFLWKHEGKKYKHGWESMVKGTVHRIHKGNWLSSYGSRNDSSWICLERRDGAGGNIHTYRTFVRRGCTTGYQCVQLLRRKKNVVQLWFGEISQNEFEDCVQMEVVEKDTLVLQNTKERCPSHLRLFSSHYLSSSPIVDYACTNGDVTVIQNCQDEIKESFGCVAHFEENGEKRLSILQSKETRRLHCMVMSSSMFSLYSSVACDLSEVEKKVPLIQENINRTVNCQSSLLAGFLYSSDVTLPSKMFPIILVFLARFIL